MADMPDDPDESDVPSSSADHGHQSPESPHLVQYPRPWLWDLTHVTQVDLKSEEAQQISKLFCLEFCNHTDDPGMAEFPSSIRRIVRLENLKLWASYCRKKEEMQKKQEGAEVRELRLFHGAPYKNIDSICKHGFQIDRPYEHGITIGKGHYYTTDRCLAHWFATGAIGDEEPAVFTSASVAETSSKAEQRSSKEDADEDRDAIMTQSVDSTGAAATVATKPRDSIWYRHYMLLCTVLTGRSVKTERIYRIPLLVILGSYDSAYHQSSRGEEYVVYNDSQVYPEYVIEYWSTEAEMFNVET